MLHVFQISLLHVQMCYQKCMTETIGGDSDMNVFLIISEEQECEKSNVSYLFCLHSHANRYCMFSKAFGAHED